MSNFRIELEVRDYECDLQGIVNNSVYQQYLEHARHKFLQARGVDFAALTAARIHLVVLRAELEYKQSLKPGDVFAVEVSLQPEGRLKWAFHQRILRLPEETLILTGKITGVSLNENGRPFQAAALQQLLQAERENSPVED